MTYRPQSRVIAAKIQAAEGTPETLAAADAAINFFEAGFTPDIAQHPRVPFSSFIESLPALTGVRKGQITMQSELVGSGVVATAPPIDVLLRACGMEKKAVVRLTIGAITGGPIPIGATATGGTSAATGKVAMVTYTGATYLYLYDVTGTFVAETITVPGGISVSASAVLTAGGNMYKPRSTGLEFVTIAEYVGEKVGSNAKRSLLSDAMGNFVLRGEVGNRVNIDFEFMGPLVSVSDVAKLAPTYPTITPQRFLDAKLKVHSNYLPALTTFELNVGNAIEVDEDANATSGSGAIAATIGRREGTGSINPRDVPTATHDFWNRMFDNSTGELTLQIGSTDGNRIFIQAPNAQYTQISPGERAFLRTAEITLGLHRKNGDDSLVLIFG